MMPNHPLIINMIFKYFQKIEFSQLCFIFSFQMIIDFMLNIHIMSVPSKKQFSKKQFSKNENKVDSPIIIASCNNYRGKQFEIKLPGTGKCNGITIKNMNGADVILTFEVNGSVLAIKAKASKGENAHVAPEPYIVDFTGLLVNVGVDMSPKPAPEGDKKPSETDH